MPKTKHAVAVVIVNWNGAAFIERCLNAVLCQSHEPAEIVVLDNGSSDDSAVLIQSQFPNIHLIKQMKNEGFARGYNLAIAETRSPHVLILNTDVFLDRDFLLHGLKALHQAPDIGSVAAKILKADTDIVENVGQFLQPWLKTVNSRIADTEEFVFSGSGAALLCRRQMLDDIVWHDAYFDESFFLYWEDADLAWRAQLRGWRCIFSPDAKAFHLGSGSQGGQVSTLQKPAFVQRHIWKNRYLIVFQNMSFREMLVLLPGLVLNELIHWLMILVYIPKRLPIFVWAHFDFVRLLPVVIRKRRFIQKRRRVGAWAALRFFRF
ncbi:MAG: glycosyltransferase family 2 protein [Candidatus Latescibacteria bacterium]|jgi:GT2 family glycosyltransferase|nr:glycosyltransferase family 2 protein [Candidatus Latescibacterota bacterium]MBT4139302.1 glycosyltransferase family 2 protein [Candidatus Latescibacterota bacterium]MBT5832312.1 glycosyltransferase family 2 protein [Candidatus Latescibacterota bacterium]